MRNSTLVRSLLAIALASGCADKDNSAETDKATHDLREAQSVVQERRSELDTNGSEIDRRKRELVLEQQQLVDKQALLERNREQLGSAQGTLAQAHSAYAAAVTQRFAKLDAGLASLATKLDAASKDQRTGLAARRDVLAATLQAMPISGDPGWAAYTKDVDTTFDAIERDLRAATH
jgi:chromosome segregation ATPase